MKSLYKVVNFLIMLAVYSKISLAYCAAEELIIISPHWEGIRYEFENGFNKWRGRNGQLPVRFVWKQIGGTSEIIRFVQSEFQTKSESQHMGIAVDIVFGGGVDPYELFKKDGYLQPHKPAESILKRIPPQVTGAPLYDSDFSWFAPTISAFGIYCNKKVLDKLGLQIPDGWEDLTNKHFKSWIVSADPRKSGSAHMYYEIILQSFGWQKGWNMLFDMANNYRTFLAASSQVALDVSYGEAACGFLLDSQAKVQMLKYGSEDYKFIVPENRSLYAGDAFAILKGSNNLHVARQFADYMLSEEAQKLWYLPAGVAGGPERYSLNRLPVYTELFNDPLIADYNPFTADLKNLPSSFMPLNFSNQLSSGRWEIVNDLIGIFLIENFDYKSLESPDCRSKLPDQNQIDYLVKSESWKDQIVRNKVLAEWRDITADCSPSLIWPGLPFLLITGIFALIIIRKILKF